MHMPSKRELRSQWTSGGPVITWAIIAVCVVIWLVEIILRYTAPTAFASFVGAGMFMSLTAFAHPWTWLTSMFLHAPSVLHIMFNMLALWSVGPVLEKMMGHWRFLALYVISGLGGAVGLMVWAKLAGAWGTAAYGASGALFGLFAALLIVYRRIGVDIRSMLMWMAVNFLLPLVVGGVAWQAHLGGFITGGVLTWLLVAGVPALRKKGFTQRMVIYGAAVVIVLIVIAWLCAPSAVITLM